MIESLERDEDTSYRLVLVMGWVWFSSFFEFGVFFGSGMFLITASVDRQFWTQYF